MRYAQIIQVQALLFIIPCWRWKAHSCIPFSDRLRNRHSLILPSARTYVLITIDVRNVISSLHSQCICF
jgi:hypothetical protein